MEEQIVIPKVIHYCWFGRGKLPALARRCIASWRTYLPDYEIKEWNETNFDVHEIRYTREAYAQRKYAFVSDYARFKILAEHGGIYFDTDVEVLAPLDDILARGPWMGVEKNLTDVAKRDCLISPGLGFAVAPGNAFCQQMVERYQAEAFLNADGSCNLTTIVERATALLLQSEAPIAPGIMTLAGFRIYPEDYFCPKTFSGELRLTPNTRTIHHFTDSWHTPRQKLIQWVKTHLGVWPACVVGLLSRNPLEIPKRLLQYLREGK